MLLSSFNDMLQKGQDATDDLAAFTGDANEARAWRDLEGAIGGISSLATMMQTVLPTAIADRFVDDAGNPAPIMTADAHSSFATLQDRLATSGLDDVEIQLMREAGVSDAEMSALVDTIVAQDPPLELTTTTTDELTEQFVAATSELAAAAADLADVAGASAAATWPGPVADDSLVETSRDSGVRVRLGAFVPVGAIDTYEIVTQPAHGTLSGNGVVRIYQPDEGYVGTDSFTWRAVSNGLVSDVATTSINVLLPAPTSVADHYGVRQGETLAVPAPGVLLNDWSERLPLSATLVRGPAEGSLSLNADGSFSYLRRVRAARSRSRTWQRSPGDAASTPTTVTLSIVDREDPPDAIDDRVGAIEDSPIVIHPLANDFDRDGDPLTLVGYTQGSLGSVSCTSVAVCTYRPRLDATGSDEWTYTVADGTGRHATGTVRVDITPVADAPVAAPDRLSFEKGSPASVNVLANDRHPDGLALELVANTSPSNGTVVCTAAGSCTYQPSASTVVGDTFTYTIRDTAGRSATSTVTVAAFAAFEEIESVGPLLYIDTGSSLSCAVEHDGDFLGSFFADFGCGTFAAVGGALYGPQRVSGSGNPPQPRTAFTPRTQSAVAGDGSFDDPFTVATGVDVGPTGVSLVQTDSYVTGEESYRTDITVRNGSGQPQTITLYPRGGLSSSATSTQASGGSILRLAPPRVAEDGRVLEWLPLSPGSSPLEAGVDELWAAIAPRTPFDGSCQCDENIDNGAGVSWTLTVAPGASATVSHLTVFSPFGYAPLQLALQASKPIVGPRTEDSYTLTVTNPISTTPVIVKGLRVDLPVGFSYTNGSTRGAVSADPSIVDGQLEWTTPITVPAAGSVQVAFDVVVGGRTGTFASAAEGNALPFSIASTGPAALVTIIDDQPPVAVATSGTPVDGAVNFDGTLSTDADGTIVAYSWDFGDGKSGTGASPAHAYELSGFYDVQLTVTDDHGLTASTIITVEINDDGPNVPPTAVSTAGLVPSVGGHIANTTPTEVVIGDSLAVRFDGRSSTDTDGMIMSWTWDFGDGTGGAGPSVDHQYEQAGVYDVILIVRDDDGATSNSALRVTVSPPIDLPPIGAFTGRVTALTASFDGSPSVDPDGPGGQPLVWAWDFGDGQSGIGMTVVHTYAADGDYSSRSRSAMRQETRTRSRNL